MNFLLKVDREPVLDKFYTNNDIAEQCVKNFLNIHSFEEYDIIIEPSAGAGVFLKYLPEQTIGLDISPEHSSIIKQDYLLWKPDSNKNYLVIGNPPFGKNSSLAKKFFNYSVYAKTIAFILPRTFKKVSIQNTLDLNFHLVFEKDLPLNSFTEFGKPKSVPCVFQIWDKKSKKRQKIVLEITHSDFVFTSKEEASFAIRRVGGLAGKVLDNFLEYADSSNYFIKATDDVKEKLRSLYEEFQIAAKNTAGNPSLSKGELVYIYKQKF